MVTCDSDRDIAYRSNGGDKEYMQNFGSKTSLRNSQFEEQERNVR
jgi:hypothetical protein